MHQPLALVVLAAGQGRRYGGLKQLDPVGPGGATLVDYAVYDALRAGFGRAVFVVRPELREEVRGAWAHLAERIDVAWAEQRLEDVPEGFAPLHARSRPWGTGHAVLAAEDAVSGGFVAINADDFYGADAFRAAAGFLRERSDPEGTEYAAVSYALRDTLSDAGAVNRALCRVDAGGWLERVTEVIGIERHGDGGRVPDGAGGWTALDGSDRVSMNFWAFGPAVFGQLRGLFRSFLGSLRDPEKDEFYLSNAVEELIRAGRARVRMLRSRSRWCGLTRPADRERAARELAARVERGEYPERLWS